MTTRLQCLSWLGVGEVELDPWSEGLLCPISIRNWNFVPEIPAFPFIAMSGAVQIPPGGTWFDTHKKSFVDVPVDPKDQGIPTSEFLEAAESTTTLFGVSSDLRSRRAR
jgi:hypothetical protein